MKTQIHIFPTADHVAAAISEQTAQIQKTAAPGSFSLALSGGSTPKNILKKLADTAGSAGTSWQAIHFFWGDERCVPPESSESNFGEAWRIFFEPARIAAQFIHPIKGDNAPLAEATHYADEISRLIPSGAHPWPTFDWIWLGLGTDGHTASLFPGAEALQDEKNTCLVARHPQSGQVRISLSLPVINQAKRVTFLLTGASKAEIAARVLSDEKEASLLPAAQVNPQAGVLEFFMDEAAARLLPRHIRATAQCH